MNGMWLFYLLSFNVFLKASQAAYGSHAGVLSSCSSDPEYLPNASPTLINQMCYWMKGPISLSCLVCTRLQAVVLHTGPTGLTAAPSLFVLFTSNTSKQMAARHSLLPTALVGCVWVSSFDCGKKPFENAGGCDLAHCKQKMIDRQEPQVFTPAVLHQTPPNQNYPFCKLNLWLRCWHHMCKSLKLEEAVKLIWGTGQIQPSDRGEQHTIYLHE